MKDDVTFFDLESHIFSCWNLVDELNVLAQAIEDKDEDEIINIIIGLKALYNRKFDRLFNAYTQVLSHQSKLKNQEKSIEPFGY
jgi:hypothetical protein